MPQKYSTKLRSVHFPTRYGTGILHAYRQHQDQQLAYAITFGDIALQQPGVPIFCRIHSACITAETFEASNCDCREQLQQAFTVASKHSGIILYLPQEGRGNGIEAKLQQMELEWEHPETDTISAFSRCGYPTDSRSYEVAVEILQDLNITNVVLYTANPQKLMHLENAGIHVASHVNYPLKIENKTAKKNIQAKQHKLGYFT